MTFFANVQFRIEESAGETFMADKDWTATLALEAGRRYRFRYLVGGKE